MTREIRVNERAVIARRTGTGNIQTRTVAPIRKKSSKLPLIINNTVRFCHEASRIKREISEKIITVAEDLADKTAREGLFGEDRGKGYAGTDVDYIER